MASTLTSASTIAQIVAAYMDNMSYEEDASTTKALAFKTACRGILVKRPRRVSFGGEEVELDLALVQKQLEEASTWLAGAAELSSGGSGYLHPDLSEFRD